MRIAAAQVLSTDDPQVNLELIRVYTERAARAGADIVVFPEAMQRAFGNPLAPVAEPLDGPWARAVRATAARCGVVIVVGMFTPGSISQAGNRRVRNTLLAVGPGIDTSYDKIHLYDAFGFRESDTVEPGLEPTMLEVDGIRIGLATCYDLRFPGLFQHYAHEGASAVVLSASWGAGPGKIEQWDTLVRARALDATCVLVACDQADPQAVDGESVAGAPTGIGRSTIIEARGIPQATAGGANEILLGEVSVDEVNQVRSALPVLDNCTPWERPRPTIARS